MAKCANLCGSNCGGICQECPTGVEIIEERQKGAAREGKKEVEEEKSIVEKYKDTNRPAFPNTNDFDEVTKPYHYQITDDVDVMGVIKWVFEGDKIEITPWKAACLYGILKYVLRSTRKNGEQDINKALQLMEEYRDFRDKED